MRIDGFSSSYSLDRSPRSGAVTPAREVQREVAERREQPAPSSGSQSFEPIAQARRAGNPSHNSLPVPAPAVSYQRPLSNHAAQALASYGSTASYTSDVDALEVLGLDLYA
ncbi:hypothetical protein D3880_06355 [Pseudomonas cavernae]|uniref:Uncharacterized protein n=1 Tax=Pseudomonas cavernae TaxID=2320867 RepID=A0A385YYR7_9PSED|nr:hypothetical protein [Pseudomonas cavernae]AYC32025.1 hypothetical protein D3880_06355 [Pseudomonas cavernae]